MSGTCNLLSVLRYPWSYQRYPLLNALSLTRAIAMIEGHFPRNVCFPLDCVWTLSTTLIRRSLLTELLCAGRTAACLLWASFLVLFSVISTSPVHKSTRKVLHPNQTTKRIPLVRSHLVLRRSPAEIVLHQHRHHAVVLPELIYYFAPLAGSRRRGRHRAERVQNSEVSCFRYLDRSDREDIRLHQPRCYNTFAKGLRGYTDNPLPSRWFASPWSCVCVGFFWNYYVPQHLDREFRRRKPLKPRKHNQERVPAPCRRGKPSRVAIFIILALSMMRRE